MSLLKIYLELSKPRILTMQLVTLTIGYYLAGNLPLHNPIFYFALLGTALTSAGAGAFNHVLEQHSDILMERTKNRPIPTNKISSIHAGIFALICICVGLFILYMKVNMLVCLLSSLTMGFYLVIYTPMKKTSWFNTLIGAIPGAIPPLGGWAAASGILPPNSWILFGILFIWQLPHFYAIAWMFKEDYEKAGYKMLSVGDTNGDKTARQILMQTIALIIISSFPFFVGMMGYIYLFGSLLLGLYFLKPGIEFNKERSFINAKAVLKASVIYLPLLLILIVIDTLIKV